jgi:hypothetical protein
VDQEQIGPPAPAGRSPRLRHGRRPGNGAVAVVLAAAAVVAAVVGTRAAMISNNATDAWQSALRTEVKRSAAAINDVSYLYQIEFPQAMLILPARLVADTLRAAAAGHDKEVALALEEEAAIRQQAVDLMSGTTPLLEGSAYVLPSGGLDLGRRLADIRAAGPEGPQLLALNPGALMETGDRLAHKASMLTLALIPISLCALLGILAQPLIRRRVWLLAGGLVALAGGAVMAVVVEVVA